ncbi:MAG: VWA domain-containing protein, partial [SAR324 cluster bacterium]|nr:VWA domain-containing protein [SAR324 cluster bacterium]
MSEFHFLRPLWLLAIPLVWLLVFRLLGKWWSTANWERIVEPHLLQFLAITPAKQKASLLPWIMCFAGTLLLLSLAGPVWEKVPQPLLQKSQARVLVLDLSFSMLATDIKPTRLDRARFKLEDLLKRFVEGDTALIAYAGEAFVISPLTHDPATIAALLPGLHPNIMPVPG